MSFFEDLSSLMKKYNLQLHTIQLDENVAKFNEVFKTSIKKEDLPPPVLLFRTTEGDFIPTIFGPIAYNPETKFINIAEPTKIIDLVPAATEEKKEESTPVKSKKTSKKSSKNIENIDDIEVNKKMLIVGPLFGKENFNIEQYTKFVDVNLGKLSIYNTLNNLLILAIGQENYANNEAIKANSKRGREVVNQLLNYVKDFDVLILLNGWDKALEAKKIVEFAKENDIELIEQENF